MLSHYRDLVGDKKQVLFLIRKVLYRQGKAGGVQIRKPGPAWKCVITRCLLASPLGAWTTLENVIFQKHMTPPISSIINQEEKQTMPVCFLHNLFWKSRGYILPLKKFPNLSYPAYNLWAHQPREQLHRLSWLHRETLVTRYPAVQVTKSLAGSLLETGIFWVLNQHNYRVEAKICTTMPNVWLPGRSQRK